jgi:hypothetical protein
MKKKLQLALIATVVISAMTYVPNARAQDKMTQDNTALSNTTISGGDIPMYNTGDSSIVTDSSTLAPSTLSESFSPSPVPEPSTIGLFAAGVLTLVVFARSKRRSFHANQQAGMP